MHYPNRPLCPGGGREERDRLLISRCDLGVKWEHLASVVGCALSWVPWLFHSPVLATLWESEYNPHFTKQNSETHRFDMKSNISAGEFGTHLFLTHFKGCPFHVPVGASNKREGLGR